jgi:single-strand DNA-binding protein
MNVLNAIVNLGGKDAEVRYTANKDAVTQFSVALQSGYGDKQVTTWLNCSLWGERGTKVASFLLKGTRIGITGELTNRKYMKDGAERYSLELRVSDITLLGSKSDNKGATSDYSDKGDSNPSPAYNDGVKDAFDNYDPDVPF